MRQFEGSLDFPEQPIDFKWEPPKWLPAEQRRKLEEEYKKRMKKIFENPYAMDSFLITDVTDPRIKFFYEVYKEDYISSMPQSRMPKKLTVGEELKVESLARDLIKEEGKIIFVAVRKVPKFVTESGSEGKIRGKFVMSLEPLGYLAFRFVPSEGMAGGDIMLRCDRIYLAEKFRGLGLATRLVMRCFGRACMLNPSLRYACFEDAIKYRTKDIIEAMRKRGLVEDVEYMAKGEIHVTISEAALERELRVIKAYERYVSAKGYKKAFEFMRLRAERRRYRRSVNNTNVKLVEGKATKKQNIIRRLFRR